VAARAGQVVSLEVIIGSLGGDVNIREEATGVNLLGKFSYLCAVQGQGVTNR